VNSKEIGIAGCLGAIAGLAVAITCEWSIVMLPLAALAGAMVAFFSYRPADVANVARQVCHACTGAWNRKTWFLQWEVRQHAAEAACYLLYGAVIVSSGIALPSLICFVAPNADRSMVAIFCVGIAWCFVGFMGVFLALVMVEAFKDVPWTMPVMRRLFRAERLITEQSNETFDKPELSWKKTFLLCAVVPPALQIVGCLLFGCVMLDMCITVLLACATSERIAAVIGATLGFCAGTILHFCGVPSPLIILAVGGSVGWFAGPLLYRLREYLSQVPAVEIVRSS